MRCTSSGATTTTMPMPRLKTLRISSSVDLAEALDLAEDPRRLPRARVDDGVGALGQHPVEVAGEAAAGDVGDGAHVDLRGAARRWPARR